MTIQERIKQAWLTIHPNNSIDDSDLREVLTEADEISCENESESRWWTNQTIVCRIGDRYFEYGWAHANRDEYITDLGWEFSWDSVHEVIPKEKVITVTTYERI